MGATPVVDVVGLRKNYGDTAVLSDVSLRAEAGQTITLLGPNGAGKTTTVEVIRGLIKRDSGSVNVLGEDPASGPGAQWQARIGMTLQSQSDLQMARQGVSELDTRFLRQFPRLSNRFRAHRFLRARQTCVQNDLNAFGWTAPSS